MIYRSQSDILQGWWGNRLFYIFTRLPCTTRCSPNSSELNLKIPMFVFQLHNPAYHSISMAYHIEAETKWPPFFRRHFQIYFLEWKCRNFNGDFTGVCSQYSSIGSDNGLALARLQAIIWTNLGMSYWRIYASLGLNELMHKRCNSSALQWNYVSFASSLWYMLLTTKVTELLVIQRIIINLDIVLCIVILSYYSIYPN